MSLYVICERNCSHSIYSVLRIQTGDNVGWGQEYWVSGLGCRCDGVDWTWWGSGEVKKEEKKMGGKKKRKQDVASIWHNLVISQANKMKFTWWMQKERKPHHSTSIRKDGSYVVGDKHARWTVNEYRLGVDRPTKNKKKDRQEMDKRLHNAHCYRQLWDFAAQRLKCVFTAWKTCTDFM